MKKPQPPQDLWAQLEAATNPPPVVNDPGVTVAEYAERYQMSVAGARELLERATREGKLLQGFRKHPRTGCKMKVFRPK